MPKRSEAPRGYERLLRESLHPGEVVDGMLQGPTLTAAITVDRLLTIGPANPNGWEMKSLPWRFLKIAPEPAADATGDEQEIHLLYFRPVRGNGPRLPAVGDPERIAERPPEPQPSGEMIFVLPSDGGKIAALLTARVSWTPPS